MTQRMKNSCKSYVSEWFPGKAWLKTPFQWAAFTIKQVDVGSYTCPFMFCGGQKSDRMSPQHFCSVASAFLSLLDIPHWCQTTAENISSSAVSCALPLALLFSPQSLWSPLQSNCHCKLSYKTPNSSLRSARRRLQHWTNWSQKGAMPLHPIKPGHELTCICWMIMHSVSMQEFFWMTKLIIMGT